MQTSGLGIFTRTCGQWCLTSDVINGSGNGSEGSCYSGDKAVVHQLGLVVRYLALPVICQSSLGQYTEPQVAAGESGQLHVSVCE